MKKIIIIPFITALFLLAFLFAPTLIADAQPVAQENAGDPITPPARLAIYYGWPSLVNEAAGDIAQAVAHLASFDIIVFGDGLEHPTHDDHSKTQQIINELRGLNIEIYGYIDMGVTTQNLPLATAQAYVDEWNAMGVNGIFWDDAGYDYGVDRARQNTLIDYTHSQGLKVFINAWNPDDVFADDPDPTHLHADDWYLAESHPTSNGQFAELDVWWNKSQRLASYREQTNVRIATMSTGNDSNSGWVNQPIFRQTLWATYLFGFDAFGFTNPAYSASGSRANKLRPFPPIATSPGTIYTGAPVGPTQHASSAIDTYSRPTDQGTIFVFGDNTTGGGIFRGGACNTTSLGDKIWPICTSTPPSHSSPFGPRQKASEGFRYDWHRGVDLPQAIGAPVYAVMDGVVRIAGSHPAYSDQIVQIRHRERAPYLYSNSLHMNQVLVAEGDLVTVGDLIGYSGESVSGFDHIHFEFREGCLYQECNRNPWNYLPYTNTTPTPPTLIGAHLNTNESLLLLGLSTPAEQLDLEGVDLIWGSEPITVAFNAINATTNRDNPHLLDHPTRPLPSGASACLFPDTYNTNSSHATYRLLFQGLAPNLTTAEAATRDLHGISSSQSFTPTLPPLTLDTTSQHREHTPGDTATFTHTLQNTSPNPLTLALSAQSAQNNPLTLSHPTLTLAPNTSQLISLAVTLNPTFPPGVGDCILLEINDTTEQSPHSLIAVNTIHTTADNSSAIIWGDVTLKGKGIGNDVLMLLVGVLVMIAMGLGVRKGWASFN